MKNARILLSILLALAVVLSLSTAAFAGSGLQVGIGKKAGEIASSQLRFYRSALISEQDGRMVVLDPFGENKLGRSFDDRNDYGSYGNLLVVADYSRLPNDLSLVKADGTVLLEDAAIIRPVDLDGRYATVTYATDVVENKEDALLFLYTREGLGDVHFEPGEDDTMYAGYSLLYDTQEQRFVGDLRLDNPGDYFSVVGENILVYRLGVHSQTLYRPDGSLVSELEYSNRSGRFFLLRIDDSEACSVCDENLNELFVLDFTPHDIFGNGALFSEYFDDGSYRLVNAAGDAVNDLIFAYSPSEYGGFVYGQDEEGSYLIVTMAGEQVPGFTDSIESVYECRYGFMEIEYRDGGCALLYPDGTIAPLRDSISGDLYSEIYDTNEIFLLDTGAYLQTDGDINTLRDLLFSVENDDYLYGLYSLVDGRELLPQKYERIEYSNGYVYAFNGEVYEIYPVTVTA